VCILYGAHASAQGQAVSGGASKCLQGAVGQGSIVAFNILRPDSSYVGYRYSSHVDDASSEQLTCYLWLGISFYCALEEHTAVSIDIHRYAVPALVGCGAAVSLY
jgi:hypothetical protein